MFSRRQLADDFRTLGVSSGDVVMMHASVRAVGEVAGGPDQIHLALKDAVGEAGTIMMYAGCPLHYDDVGRGWLTAEQERETLEKLPAFDPLTVRSARSHGVLVEFLRTYPGTVVNHHVTRFATAGRHAAFIVSPQPWNYAFGLGSPLDRFLQLDGKILLLGCDHNNVTFLHYAEHVVDIPNKKIARYKVPVEEDGRRIWRDMEEFNTGIGEVHDHWPDRFFAMIVDTYLTRTGNQGGRVGRAMSHLFSARGVLDVALPIMKAVAADAQAAADLREIEATNPLGY